MLRRLPLLLAFVLLTAACNGASEGATTSTDDAPPGTSGSTSTTAAPSSTTTTTAAPPITAPDLSGIEGLSSEARQQLEGLITAAQEIRQLAFIEPPTIRVVTEEELEQLVREEIAESAEDLPADEALYKVLGLLADSADFETILSDLYGEQVAGFYDGDTDELVVPVRDDGFSLIQQGTVIHELVHALTDQHFDFNTEFEAMIDGDRLDQATAYQALIEGDATLAEIQWVQGLTQREIGQFLAESLEIDSSALDGAPRFLVESLIFPYDTGLSFAQSIHSDGGWEAVNDAYELLVDLPGSSEQVITPADYGEDLPMAVAIPEIVIDGYELERTSVWGEQGFRLMLNQGSTVSDVAPAADGWGGDTYHQWFDGENAALMIAYQGDTADDMDELEAALTTFASESFPSDNYVWVGRDADTLYFVAADETPVGEQIRAILGLD